MMMIPKKNMMMIPTKMMILMIFIAEKCTALYTWSYYFDSEALPVIKVSTENFVIFIEWPYWEIGTSCFI